MKGEALLEIEVLAAVARLRSFGAAAQQLGLSTSAASRAVSRLEARLEVRLLQRTTRKVVPTEAGRAYLARCEPALEELRSAGVAARELSGELRGRLRVAAPPGFGTSVLMPALQVFLARHPQLSIDLQLANRRVDVVGEGFDLALRIGALSADRTIARRIGQSARLLVASPAYLAAHGEPRHPRELAAHRVLVQSLPDDEGTATRWQLFSRGSTHAIELEPLLRSNNGPALLAATQAGLGIALLPDFFVAPLLRSGDLKRLAPRWSGRVDPISAIYPGYRLIPSKVRTLVDHIRDSIEPANQLTSARLPTSSSTAGALKRG